MKGVAYIANKNMELHIYLKAQKEPIVYKGDRIDALDFELEGVKYKQIRCFRKGSSRSELVEAEAISKMVEKN